MTVDEAIRRFLAELAIGRSERTVRTYATALHRFREYLATLPLPSPVPVASLGVDEAINFVEWLVNEHFGGEISKTTLRTYLAALSRFYTYLIREKLSPIPSDEHLRLKEAYRGFRRGSVRPLPRVPAEEAVERLLAAARSVPPRPGDRRYELRRLRNIAMLEALRCTGMRVGELVELRRGDLDYRQRAARVKGKGGRERMVYFDDVAWGALQTYLRARGDGARGSALYRLPLFARHDRRAGGRVLPLSTNSVRQVFRDLLKLADVDQPLTPHSLRHAFATRVLEATEDLAVVQDLLGHSSPSTTRIYAKVSSRRLREAHRRAFGYGGEGIDG